MAASTLGRVCLDTPDVAIEPLAKAATDPSLVKPALSALINFGVSAARAASVFMDAYESRDATVRSLAIRGLHTCKADDPRSLNILERAKSDTNKKVRDAATRKI